MLSITNSEPCGINSAAARSSAVLNDPRRRLPEIPTILVMTDGLQRFDSA